MAKDRRYWKTVMEAQFGEPIPDQPPENEKTSLDETQIIEEMVYPYQMTVRMIEEYTDPAYNRDHLSDGYFEIMRKLLRSVQFWRLDVPKWLLARIM